jgi:hypothetical protein
LGWSTFGELAHSSVADFAKFRVVSFLPWVEKELNKNSNALFKEALEATHKNS